MVIILFQEHNTDTLYIELGLKSDSHSWVTIRYIELLLLISDRIDVRINKEMSHKRQAVGYTIRKEVRPMRITFHIFEFTITIIVKQRKNRHSAK